MVDAVEVGWLDTAGQNAAVAVGAFRMVAGEVGILDVVGQTAVVEGSPVAGRRHLLEADSPGVRLGQVEALHTEPHTEVYCPAEVDKTSVLNG